MVGDWQKNPCSLPCDCYDFEPKMGFNTILLIYKMDLLQIRVLRTIAETEDSSSLVLEELSGKTIDYQAGQFITLVGQKGDSSFRRSYSFASTPGVDSQPMITVKRVPNGQMSRLLTDRVQPLDQFLALPPAGRFTIQTIKGMARQFCFIAAGIGIVPIFSLIKKILYEEPLSQVLLIYQNYDEDHTVFFHSLSTLLNRFTGQLRWINLLSHPKTKPARGQRLNNSLLEVVLSQQGHLAKGGSLYFVCGPQSFMRMVNFTLRYMGIDAGRIRMETFVVSTPQAAPWAQDRSPKKIQLHLRGKTYLFEAAYPVNILQAALDNNIDMPYSCRGGICSSCMARILKGNVKMSINEVLTDSDLAEGLVLTCVGYPQTDIIIEV